MSERLELYWVVGCTSILGIAFIADTIFWQWTPPGGTISALVFGVAWGLLTIAPIVYSALKN